MCNLPGQWAQHIIAVRAKVASYTLRIRDELVKLAIGKISDHQEIQLQEQLISGRLRPGSGEQRIGDKRRES